MVLRTGTVSWDVVSDVAEDTPKVSLVSVPIVPILLAIPGAPIIDGEDVVDIVTQVCDRSPEAVNL